MHYAIEMCNVEDLTTISKMKNNSKISVPLLQYLLYACFNFVSGSCSCSKAEESFYTTENKNNFCHNIGNRYFGW